MARRQVMYYPPYHHVFPKTQQMNTLIPKDNRTVINPDSISIGFTQSEMGTWDDCAEKWYLGYNHMLRRKGMWTRYFVYGTAFHKTMQSFYTDGSEEIASLQLPPDVILDTAGEAEIDLWERILQVQMQQYFRHYRSDLDNWTPTINEEIVTVEFEGIKFTGKLDLGFDDPNFGLVLCDHKSASRFDGVATDGWTYRFQFMFYWWLYEKAFGVRPDKFMVNGLKKPALKQGKTESIPSFVARIQQDMVQRPEEYFKRVNLPYIAGSMEHFEERVLRPKVERIKLLLTQNQKSGIIETLARNQNTNNCVKYGKKCEFMPICQHGWKAEGFQYVQRENKHEELEEE